MIAACPKCQTRYRVEPERLGPDGARLRCSQCSAVFRVRLPAEQPIPAEQSVPAADQGTFEGKAHASDAAALGGVARSEPKASEARKARVTQSNQPLSAEGRSAPQDLAPQSQDIESQSRTPGPSHEAPQFDQSRLVLIAHPNPDACKRIAETLEREGLQVLVAHDGVEAILSIQRALPRAVVLDAALPKMFGFQVCELIKRNESLRVTHVCLMGAIHRDDRYRRAPSETYGADFYVEGAQLSVALIDWLGRVGFELRSRRSTPTPPPTPERAPEAPRAVRPSDGEQARSLAATGVAQPVAAERSTALASGNQAPAAAERPAAQSVESAPRAAQPVALGRIGVAAQPLAAERAQAERLARIIVSDIVLYNEAKFSAAVRSGSVLESMRDELQEGRALFRERIDVQVRDERDFLADELVRVARARSVS